jgi:hypothetical protein
MSVPPHQDIPCQEQILGKGNWFRRGVVCRAGWRPSCQDSLEIRNEGWRWILRRIQELTWQEWLGTVHGVSW